MKTKAWPRVIAALAVLLAGATALRANPFEYTWQPLAPGVWAGIREDPFALPQEGNAAFVVTDQGVVVFDAGGSPAMGQSIVDQVRKVTPQPITHVVISHWHGDHMRGLQSIRAAFPQAEILAHPHTREQIASTADRWLKRRVSMVPHIRQAVTDALAKGQDLSGRPLGPAEKAWLDAGMAITEQLDHENNATTYVVPEATVDGRLTLYLGGREIQILSLGNAHTAGDLVMWLPQDRIVATGDIVTAPIPLMPSPYTNDYVVVLERLEGLGFTQLIPGHGLVQHDQAYVDLLLTTLRTVSAQMSSFVAQGLAEADAVAGVDFSAVEGRFTQGDPFLTNRFADYVAAALPHAAYLAATGKPPEESF